MLHLTEHKRMESTLVVVAPDLRRTAGYRTLPKKYD